MPCIKICTAIQINMEENKNMNNDKMTRRDIRECTFIILFEKMFQKEEPLEEIYSMAIETGIPFCDDVSEKVEGVISHIEEFDGIISGHSKSRTLSRIAQIDKVILYIALYEIIYDDKVPDNVAVNEAVLLSKKFTYKEDTSFINGLLGAYLKETGKNYNEEHR